MSTKNDYLKNHPLIIYGPQGCGKTLNSEALAAFFGKTNIVDNFSRIGKSDKYPELTADDIAFTESIPFELPFMNFKAAMEVAGISLAEFQKKIGLPVTENMRPSDSRRM